jgi:hypothetical protein
VKAEYEVIAESVRKASRATSVGQYRIAAGHWRDAATLCDPLGGAGTVFRQYAKRCETTAESIESSRFAATAEYLEKITTNPTNPLTTSEQNSTVAPDPIQTEENIADMALSDRLFRESVPVEALTGGLEQVVVCKVSETATEYLIAVPKALSVDVLKECKGRGGLTSIVRAEVVVPQPLRIDVTGTDSTGINRTVALVAKPIEFDLSFKVER